MESATPDMMTPGEVALRLGIAPKTLANQRSCPECRSGSNCAKHPLTWVKITGVIGQPGGAIRYPRDTVEAVIAARTRGGVAA